MVNEQTAIADAEVTTIPIAFLQNMKVGERNQVQVRGSRMFDITDVGMVFRGQPDLETIRCMVHMFAKLDRAKDWCLGDIYAYGVKTFGETQVREIFAQAGFDEDLFERISKLSQLQMAERRSNVSVHHHARLASLEMHERALWMERIIEHDLSYQELMLSLEKGVVTKWEKRRKDGLRQGFDSIEGTISKTQRWITKADPLHKFKTAEKRQLASILKPLALMYKAIVEEVGE